MRKPNANTPQPGRAPQMRRMKPNHKAEHNDAGMIRAMHAHADEMHPVGVTGPRVSPQVGGDTNDSY